jgi:hypothetical protein
MNKKMIDSQNPQGRVAKNLKSQLTEHTRGQQLIDLRNRGENYSRSLAKPCDLNRIQNADNPEAYGHQDISLLRDFDGYYSGNKCWN